jgi:cytochrome d ubiquinol oxidase subunit I
MLAMWGMMVFSALLGVYYLKKKNLHNAKWTLRLLVLSVIYPQIANQSGWITAEMGRQPWVVYKLLRTQDGASSTVAASQVFSSILVFLLIYSLLFALFMYLLDQKIKHGPEEKVGDDSSQTEYRDRFSKNKEDV